MRIFSLFSRSTNASQQEDPWITYHAEQFKIITGLVNGATIEKEPEDQKSQFGTEDFYIKTFRYYPNGFNGNSSRLFTTETREHYHKLNDMKSQNPNPRNPPPPPPPPPEPTPEAHATAASPDNETEKLNECIEALRINLPEVILIRSGQEENLSKLLDKDDFIFLCNKIDRDSGSGKATLIAQAAAEATGNPAAPDNLLRSIEKLRLSIHPDKCRQSSHKQYVSEITSVLNAVITKLRQSNN